MADGIQVVCSNCGRDFVVGEDLAAHSVTCPRCEGQVAVPFSSEQQTQRPRLQVRRDTPVAGGKACPSCGAAMAAEAVICVHCGFDTRTGTSWQGNKSTHKKKIWAAVMTVAGVFIVAGWLHLWLKSRLESGPIGEQPTGASAPAALAVSSTSPAESATAATPQLAGSSAVSSLAGESSVVVTSSPVSAESTIMDAARNVSRADLEIQLTQALNARYPLYALGAQAVLRQHNGLVHRGEIVELGTNSVTLKTEMGLREISFSVLDKESRLRCDADARRRLVSLRVEQMMSAPMTP